jgi:hypothetical protein
MLHVGHGHKLFELMCVNDLEGVVAKRRDARCDNRLKLRDCRLGRENDRCHVRDETLLQRANNPDLIDSYAPRVAPGQRA